ncbi:MAG: DUF2520 domain-containing protein [Elusimicrobiales bacterium]|nr:DUF2520 domain-containing protein [Elusimicrobiales bacterium]
MNEQRKAAGSRVYGIAGGGKLASHLARYLDLLQLPCRRWSGRTARIFPRSALSECSVVIIAISDDAIENFIRENLDGSRALLVHCSGALSTPLAHGAHPLTVFGTKPYPLSFYKKIPFITEKGRAPFAELFPDLPNPHYAIDPAQKPFYHALCSMSGNFSAILWKKFFAEMSASFGIPKKTALMYFRAAALNIAGPCDLTGPLARGDKKTISKHLRALENDSFAGIYNAFAAQFAARHKEKTP